MPELVCSAADRDAWLTARRSGITAPSPMQEVARLRDIPASCVCGWEWRRGDVEYRRIVHVPACAWHSVGVVSDGR
jgi:hypothetical protein